jgi:hypothetical protein
MFKPWDPKIYPPSWCPRYNHPAQLKIYCYKNPETAMWRDYFRIKGLAMTQSGPEYALRYQGSSPVSAYEFQDRLKGEPLWQLLGEKAHPYEVIEIDDGIVPHFFYVTENSVEYPLPSLRPCRQNMRYHPSYIFP